MNFSLFHVGLLMLLFGIGALLVRSLDRLSSQERVEPEPVMCRRHEWVRRGSEGLVCEWCGKIPG